MSAAQHIEWLNLVEKTGPFLAVGVLDEAFPQGLEKVETRKRQRVRSAYDEWRDAVDAEDPQLAALHCEWVRLVLEELLEYEPSVLKSADALPATLSYREPLSGAEVKPDFAVLSGDKARLLIASCAPDTDLAAPLARETWTASPVERMIALCRSTGVRVGLVTNGERWMVVSVPADGSSSLGTWFARIWQQETVTLQAFVSLLEVRRCFGPAEANLDSLFLRSLEHQNEVTDTLGEQVRRAVEVLVQALDRADLDRDRQLLKDVTPAQLYEAGLTVMMRLVVLLCAEERKLLLLGEPIYDQNYAASTLRSKLREDKERLGDEVLERRHDAWARLLAVFRAVFGGIEHETLRLPALGGSLFDPDRFPFLEGRATGTSWRSTPAVPLPIDNRTVFMLLTALQVLEQRTGALLLSYEALDVEQIGHVYEGLLERTVKRVPETTLGLIGSQKAVNPNVPLAELETEKSAGDGKLLEFLSEKTGRSESGLKSALAKKVDEPLYHRVLLACGSDIALADRIKPFSLLLRTDSWGAPLAYRKDSFIVTLGAGRRETGTHYTPKTLTEPIVQHTLEPLVYVGPADGKPQSEWRLRSPREMLALKVCDMAMGSAAFLVQTCRWLGDRLVEAWDAAEKAGRAVSIEGDVLDQPDGAELLPRDKGERVLIARRLIASRCLYGVDKNPMATELAKVSLWLVTMMKGRPFSFLDHALKCGDSLLGVSSFKQIENFSLRFGEQQVTFATANLFRYVEEASKKRRELEELPSNDYTQIETKSRLNAEAEAAIAKVKALADCLIALELLGLEGEAYEQQRVVAADHAEMAMRKELLEFQNYARNQLHGLQAFHWPVEFPESIAGGGFDAFVGNPPFLGGKRISGELGTDYRNFLVTNLAGGRLGNTDLCAFFFLRVHSLLNKVKGVAGLIATNTIAQGDTREVGLAQILENATILVRAVSSQPWPGTASLEVAHLWFVRQTWLGKRILDGREVAQISSFLAEPSGTVDTPFPLVANGSRSFIGNYVLGLGFVLKPEQAQHLISKDVRNRMVLFPYLNGEDLNSRPDQSPTRWVINFRDWPLDRSADGCWSNAKEEQRENWLKAGRVPGDYPNTVAADFPDCLEIVERLVKPERTRKDEQGDFVLRYPLYERWWQFAEKQKALIAAIEGQATALVRARIANMHSMFLAPMGWVYNEKIVVFPGGSFALFQSTIHEIWARRYSSTLKADMQYTPSNCCETFPFPRLPPTLNEIGNSYHEFRNQIMRARQEGLTKTYNRFHDPEEHDDKILQLRKLHIDIDRAVAEAYGWSDLELGHGFHKTKQGVRFTLSEVSRRVILDRLLQLNHHRYAEEIKAGLHQQKSGKSKKRQSNVSISAQTPNTAPNSLPQKELFP